MVLGFSRHEHLGTGTATQPAAVAHIQPPRTRPPRSKAVCFVCRRATLDDQLHGLPGAPDGLRRGDPGHTGDSAQSASAIPRSPSGPASASSRCAYMPSSLPALARVKPCWRSPQSSCRLQPSWRSETIHPSKLLGQLIFLIPSRPCRRQPTKKEAGPLVRTWLLPWEAPGPYSPAGSGGGCLPAANRIRRKFTRPSLLSCNASTVARPVGVLPTIRVESSLQTK